MSRAGKAVISAVSVLFALTAASLAAPRPHGLPLTVHNALAFAAPVDLRTEGQVVSIHLVGGDRTFQVNASTPDSNVAGVPAAFHTESAHILYWQGHLLVIAPAEGRAFHFSVRGLVEPRELTGAATPEPRPAGSPSDLDQYLAAKYQLARVETATAILSHAGPAAPPPMHQHRFLRTDDYQDLNSGGTGGSSCTQTCPNGSSCSATCPAGTGGVTSNAKCSCNPSASCTCG